MPALAQENPKANWLTRLVPRNINRETLLPVYLAMVSGNSLLFWFIPGVYHDARANLLHALLVVLLFPFARYRAAVVHLATLWSWLLMLYITAVTGGVNSSGMVWMSALVVAILLFNGARHTLPWMVLILGGILAMQWLTLAGWVNPRPQTGAQGLVWAFMNHAMAMGNLMLVVVLYERMHLQKRAELARRNQTLESTRRQLLQARAHKDEFVAAVGHELRTPMNAILGLNSVLRQELADRPEQVEVVDHIRRSTQQLLRLVNDVLDFSQLQADKLVLHPEDFDLADLLHQALDTHRPRAEHKKLGLTLSIAPEVPRHVHADRRRMQQVLDHLLHNAVKFTDQGQVQLRALVHGGQLRLEVQDSGRGIAPARQAHIFRRFEQADLQTTRAYGGTGLGLTLCERLVALQGGRIGVESQLNQGSLFWVELPMQASHGQPGKDATGDRLAGQELGILVVDDNAVNLMVSRVQLGKILPHARVATASSAQEALQLLDQQHFDVALVDMVMPEMDGLQLTQHVRARAPAPIARMPIIALTANTNPVERERCLAAGMDDVMHKPMDLDALMHCIRRHLQSPLD